MSEYILALDQSTGKSGYCILDTDYQIIEYGVWDKKLIADTSDYGHVQKRNSLKRDIQLLLNEYPAITQVICEGIYANNIDVHKKLSKLQGCIEDLCFDLKVPCFCFVNPGEWRKHLPVKFPKKRDEIKAATREFVLSKYPELNDDLEEDVYDGIAIAIAYLKMINIKEKNNIEFK